MDSKELKHKQIVFTVATGRCGTAFLAEILRLVPGADSRHEPNPEYVGVLRAVQTSPGRAKEFLVQEKLPAIAAGTSSIYIETSHLFCKGFLEPLLELDIVPALIWMRRPHRDVASSMFRGGTIPGRTDKGLQFYLCPDDPDVLPCSNWQGMHDYQLCYWYCLEMERRALKYRELYRTNGWNWGETSISGISTAAGLRQLLVDLGLPKMSIPSWLRYFNNRRRKVNPTARAKQKIPLPDGLDELENAVKCATEGPRI